MGNDILSKALQQISCSLFSEEIERGLCGSYFGQYPGPSRNKDPAPYTCYLVVWAWFTAVILG